MLTRDPGKRPLAATINASWAVIVGLCAGAWTAATCRRFPRARRVAPSQSGLVRLHSKGKRSYGANQTLRHDSAECQSSAYTTFVRLPNPCHHQKRTRTALENVRSKGARWKRAPGTPKIGGRAYPGLRGRPRPAQGPRKALTSWSLAVLRGDSVRVPLRLHCLLPGAAGRNPRL
jgi:hypothetical protein